MRLSVDDACASDTRVADLVAKYEIETTFYWPVEWHSLAYEKGYKPLPVDEAYQIAQKFEVGSHTITHRHLTRIPREEAVYEIVGSKVILQLMFGRKITKFCPPRGYTNDDLTDVTLSTYKSQRLTRGKELVHIHPDSGANNNRPWRECITEDTKEIWGHSHEFDRYNLWPELEGFLSQCLT